MWRGPVPCVHHHPEHSGEGVFDAALSRHLSVYHRHGRGEHTSEWHFHFLLPWTGGDSDEDGSPGSSHDPVIAGRLLLPDPPVGDTFADHCRSVDLPAVSAPLVECPAAETPPREITVSARYIASLLSTAPLCAVIGVALN